MVQEDLVRTCHIIDHFRDEIRSQSFA